MLSVCVLLLSACLLIGCGQDILTAAKWGNTWAVRKAIAANPEAIYTQDRYGNTPMGLAIHAGHPSIVVLLLDAGYPIDGPVGLASRPTPPIIDCPSWATSESVKIMTLLLERGADPNIEWISGQSDHWWALELATNNRRYDQVALLLKSGANPNKKCSDPTHPACSGLTPLEQAKRQKRLWADPEFEFHHEVEMTPSLRRRRIKSYQKMIDLYEKHSKR